MKIQHKTGIAPAATQYPVVGEQLAAIVKFAAAMREQGMQMPDDVSAWLDKCASVKAARKAAQVVPSEVSSGN